MRIKEIIPKSNYKLRIFAEDGRCGDFDVSPYLQYPAFRDLRNPDEFKKVTTGGYFIEWGCGADLSADTIEARWNVFDRETSDQTA